ncbi:MAG TPA: hypothetical protein VK593_04825, partial [Edaphobacter sp.]|nr:hypothetical protein [Edaphobacter sp.]
PGHKAGWREKYTPGLLNASLKIFDSIVFFESIERTYDSQAPSEIHASTGKRRSFDFGCAFSQDDTCAGRDSGATKTHRTSTSMHHTSQIEAVVGRKACRGGL